MKRYYVQYTPQWQRAPMSFWVHRETDGKPWYQATTFEPPLPRPVPGKGYARYYVELDGFTFEFASLTELDACVETFSQKHLPGTARETRERGRGPESHWLNKLPADTKSWRYRSKAVEYLKQARQAFEKETGQH